MRHGGVVGFDVAHLGQYVEFPQKLLVHWTHRENSKSRKMKIIHEIGGTVPFFLEYRQRQHGPSLFCVHNA